MKKKVFLGGTCNDSSWRDELIELLEIDYFNPVVDTWGKEAQKKELEQREECDYCLYVITPETTGVYSIALAVDDSNKRPEKALFCFLLEYADKSFDVGQIKSLEQTARMIKMNGGTCFCSLKEIARYLNKKNNTRF